MSRYIDANALIEAIKNDLWDWDSLDGITSATALKQTITDIQNAPTVDAAEVIRCRNCLHGKTLGDVGTWCDRHEGLWPNAGYCSKGERREDDAEIH